MDDKISAAVDTVTREQALAVLDALDEFIEDNEDIAVNGMDSYNRQMFSAMFPGRADDPNPDSED